MVDAVTTGNFLTTGGAAAVGAAIAMVGSALAAAWSQGSIGSSAMGAIAERPELEPKMIVYFILPEIIAILGFIIAFLMISAVK